jgi:pyruvate dehydrogenase complex dehydrogenase (E1) component
VLSRFWTFVGAAQAGQEGDLGFFFGHSRPGQLAILMPVGQSTEEDGDIGRPNTNEDAIRPYAGEAVGVWMG